MKATILSLLRKHILRRAGAACLILLLLSSPCSGATLNDYLEGGKDPYRCFPHVDSSNCEPTKGIAGIQAQLSRGGRYLSSAFDNCLSPLLESKQLATYGAICMMLASGIGGVVGSVALWEYAKGEVASEGIACLFKVIVDATDWPKKDKEYWIAAIDAGKETVDWLSYWENVGPALTNDARSAAKFNEYRWKAYAEATDRTSGLDAYWELYEARATHYATVIGNAKTLHEKALDYLEQCDFEKTNRYLNLARQFVCTYARDVGPSFRQQEKALRCFEENNVEMLTMQHRSPGAGNPQLERFNTLLRRYHDARKTILSELALLEKAQATEANASKKKTDMNRKRDDWARLFKSAQPALNGDDLRGACETIKALKNLEDPLTFGCRKYIMVMDGKSLGGSAELTWILNQKTREKEADIEKRLAQIEQDMNVCRLDQVEPSLVGVKNELPKLCIFTGTACEDSARKTDLSNRFASLQKRLVEMENQRNEARARLEKALYYAKDLCLYDQALTGERSTEEITELARKGCVPDQELTSKLNEIGAAQTATRQAAEQAEQAVAAAIEKARKSIDASVPACDVSAANESLRIANDNLAKLKCENTEITASGAVYDRAYRLFEAVTSAQAEVNRRTDEIRKSETAYKTHLDTLRSLANDPCRYSEALAPENLEKLTTLAGGWCHAGAVESDRKPLEETAGTWEKRIKADLKALEDGRDEIDRERDCDRAQKLADGYKARVAYLVPCTELRQDIEGSLKAMTDAIEAKGKRAEEALVALQQKGEDALKACKGLEDAKTLFREGDAEKTCLSPESAGRRDEILGRIERKVQELARAGKNIRSFLLAAAKSIRDCQWNEAQKLLSKARGALPVEPCLNTDPRFVSLQTEIAGLESQKAHRQEQVSRTMGALNAATKEGLGFLKQIQQQGRTDRTLDLYEKQADVARSLIQYARDSKFDHCIPAIIGDANTMLAQSPDGFRAAGLGTTVPLGELQAVTVAQAPPMASLPPAPTGSGPGFGPAGPGRTEPVSPAPSWSPPLSHGDQIGARGQPVAPDAYRWYVMCDRANGTVVFGKDWDPSRHVILAGPFEGPRTAQNWIGLNCPAARCNAQGACTAGAPYAAAAGGNWYVMCNRHDGTIVYGQHPDVSRQFILAGPLPGAQTATAWITANCPSARCTQTGACASGPVGGGSWYVLCNRDDGNVVMSKNVDPSRQIVWQGNLRGEWDARQWIAMNCPSARCDRNGRCTQQAAPIPVPAKPPQPGPAIGQRPGGPSDFCNEQYRRFQDALRNNQTRYANDILQASRGCWFYSDGTRALQQAQSRPPVQNQPQVQSKPQARPSVGKPGPAVTPTPAPPKPATTCNRRAKCESWDARGRRWVLSTGYGGGFGREVEVGGACTAARQTRCWDDCDKRWRCYETR